MSFDYWHRQTADKPLFPDLLWSRPENKSTAGKLAIIGGHSQGFAAVAQAFALAQKSGIGSVRLVLPISLQKLVGKNLPEAEFAPVTPSGSFAKSSLAEWLEAANWADGVLLAGDFGHNSETAIVLEEFINKYSGQITLTGDSLDYFNHGSSNLLNREATLLVPVLNQLQKLMTAAKLSHSLASTAELVQQIETLHKLTAENPVSIAINLGTQSVVSVNGQVSTTPDTKKLLEMASLASVWWLQNPTKTFEALTTSLNP